MKPWVLVVLFACGGDSDAPDSADAGNLPDAAVEPSCARTIDFNAGGVVPHAIAIEGTTALVAAGQALIAVPLDGGPQTTVATAGQGRMAVASRDGVAYYAAVAGGEIEIRTRAGLHATVPAPVVYEIAIDATDIYVLAEGTATRQLWRVPRSAQPVPVAIATVPASVQTFDLATTFAAFNADGVLYSIPIPAGGTATAHGMGGTIIVVGDFGISITGKIMTSNAYTLRLDRFLPGAKSLFDSTLFSSSGSVYADDRYLYLQIHSKASSPNPHPPSLRIWDAATGAPAATNGCVDFDAYHRIAYDATQLYGLRPVTGGAVILVAARAP